MTSIENYNLLSTPSCYSYYLCCSRERLIPVIVISYEYNHRVQGRIVFCSHRMSFFDSVEVRREQVAMVPYMLLPFQPHFTHGLRRGRRMGGRNIESASNTFTLRRASDRPRQGTPHPRRISSAIYGVCKPRRMTSTIPSKIVFCWAVIVSSVVLWG